MDPTECVVYVSGGCIFSCHPDSPGMFCGDTSGLSGEHNTNWTINIYGISGHRNHIFLHITFIWIRLSLSSIRIIIPVFIAINLFFRCDTHNNICINLLSGVVCIPDKLRFQYPQLHQVCCPHHHSLHCHLFNSHRRLVLLVGPLPSNSCLCCRLFSRLHSGKCTFLSRSS